MKRDRRTTAPKLAGTIACCIVSVVALSLDTSGENMVRASIRDTSLPGLMLGDWLHRRSSTLDMSRWPWTASVPEELETENAATTDVEALERELRQVRFELAATKRELRTFEVSLGPIGPSSEASALQVQRIAARVIACDDGGNVPGGLILAAGTATGVGRSALAVQTIAFIASGQARVPPHASVLAGAAVVGRTNEVGHWTASVMPVTDPEFHAHVTLVSMSPDGPRLGEQGVIEGDGRDGCIVKYVPSTAAVAVGDHVYSFDPTGRIPQPLYYGEVDGATLRDSAPHWEIHLRPAASSLVTDEVQILIPRTLESLSSSER